MSEFKQVIEHHETARIVQKADGWWYPQYYEDEKWGYFYLGRSQSVCYRTKEEAIYFIEGGDNDKPDD